MRERNQLSYMCSVSSNKVVNYAQILNTKIMWIRGVSVFCACGFVAPGTQCIIWTGA